MLTRQQLQLNSDKTSSIVTQSFASDKTVVGFLRLSLAYLLLGLFFGVIGGFQYILPDFLKEHLSFQKTRPLHVYLVISWIFTAAQGGIYYFLPRITGRPLSWPMGAKIHLLLQGITSLFIITAFFMGYFGGREYLEFPPIAGLFIALTWLPFAINFFSSLKPNLAKAPVYVWMWSLGIIFFYITLSESYLWVFDYFRNNEIRDITVQWKALGSMVGSWNMLVYGSSMYIMCRLTGSDDMARSPVSFFFFFVGFTNLMFNWGHHTYIVPAASWVKTTAYVISMTELLIFGHIIYKWRKTLSDAQKNFHNIPYRLLSIADAWIFLNLGVAIAISIPALNFYTHGTHITVAHAMGTTIGINTMLLFAVVLYIIQDQKPFALPTKKRTLAAGITITNISLIVFWSALIGSGLVKISGKLNNELFQTIMSKSQPFFRIFTFSGVFILVGLTILITAIYRLFIKEDDHSIVLTADKSKKVALETVPD